MKCDRVRAQWAFQCISISYSCPSDSVVFSCPSRPILKVITSDDSQVKSGSVELNTFGRDDVYSARHAELCSSVSKRVVPPRGRAVVLACAPFIVPRLVRFLYHAARFLLLGRCKGCSEQLSRCPFIGPSAIGAALNPAVYPPPSPAATIFESRRTCSLWVGHAYHRNCLTGMPEAPTYFFPSPSHRRRCLSRLQITPS